MIKFFFESYRPEIHRKLHNSCCERIVKLFLVVSSQNKFCINFSFFEFFRISRVMDFLINDNVFF